MTDLWMVRSEDFIEHEVSTNRPYRNADKMADVFGPIVKQSRNIELCIVDATENNLILM